MMYGWWDYGTTTPWFGMFLGPLMMIIVIAVTVLIVAWIVRALPAGRSSGAERSSALDILSDRFARGEIDRKEYEERRHVLSGS